MNDRLLDWTTDRKLCDAMYASYKRGASKLRRACRKVFGNSVEVFQRQYGRSVTVNDGRHTLSLDILGADGSVVILDHYDAKRKYVDSRTSSVLPLGIRMSLEELIRIVDGLAVDVNEFDAALLELHDRQVSGSNG